jgi:hypothetical protein
MHEPNVRARSAVRAHGRARRRHWQEGRRVRGGAMRGVQTLAFLDCGRPGPSRASPRSDQGSAACVGGVSGAAISAISLLRMAWPNELKFSAAITNAPGPPMTLLR